MTHKLFVYGTLRLSEILRRLIGCELEGRAAWLDNYRSSTVRGAAYPGIRAGTGWVTAGVVYRGVTASMLATLDDYEGEMYERRKVVVRYETGIPEEVTAYVIKDAFIHVLSDDEWDLEVFVSQHKARYLDELSAQDARESNR